MTFDCDSADVVEAICKAIRWTSAPTQQRVGKAGSWKRRNRKEINYQVISPWWQLNVTHKFADCTSLFFLCHDGKHEKRGIHADRRWEIEKRGECGAVTERYMKERRGRRGEKGKSKERWSQNHPQGLVNSCKGRELGKKVLAEEFTGFHLSPFDSGNHYFAITIFNRFRPNSCLPTSWTLTAYQLSLIVTWGAEYNQTPSPAKVI